MVIGSAFSGIGGERCLACLQKEMGWHKISVGGLSSMLQGGRPRPPFLLRQQLRHNDPMQQAITRDPEIMHGTPVFRGTRVPVQTLFDYLEGGETLEDFLEGFPTVPRELALHALEEAKQLLLARL